MSRVLRFLRGLPAAVGSPVLAVVLAVAAVVVLGVGPAPAGAAPSRAVVIIDTGSAVRTEVISFSGSISGVEALRLAGADPVTYGYAGQGAGVCALDGVGHPGTDDCLGTADDPRYWSYWHATDGATGWTYARECACTFMVHDGDVEGWKFGTGARPPFRSFCDVVGCAPAPAPPPGPGGDPGPAPSPSPGGSSPTLAPSAPSGGDPGAPEATTTTAVATGPSVSTTAAPVRVSRADATHRTDPGSPTGLLVALGVAVVAVGTTVLMRRRRAG